MSLMNSARSLGYDATSNVITLYNQTRNVLSQVNLSTGSTEINGQGQSGPSLKNGIGFRLALNGYTLHLLNSSDQSISNVTLNIQPPPAPPPPPPAPLTYHYVFTFRFRNARNGHSYNIGEGISIESVEDAQNKLTAVMSFDEVASHQRDVVYTDYPRTYTTTDFKYDYAIRNGSDSGVANDNEWLVRVGGSVDIDIGGDRSSWWWPDDY